MSFFEELKRRNVFRVAFGYVVSSWLLAQVADLVLENIGAPDWVMQAILLVLALGFPVVVFFAWAFEVTPEGIKREAEVDRSQSITHVTGRRLDRAIFAVLIAALAYFVWEARFRVPSTPAATGPATDLAADPAATAAPNGETAASASPGAAGAPDIAPRSIAVLPFENRSRLEDDTFFVEGIHDDLLTNLARIGSMKVISRTSVSRYAETDKSIPEIAKELGVATVMEGAVQRAGSQVRINVQLIDAETDEHLWAEIFDRELTAENLFAIQSEISEEIARALQATLSPEEQQRISNLPTENLEAYNAYLRARQLLARRTSSDIAEGVREIRRAVELDPGFALAWATVDEAVSLLASYGTLPFPEAAAEAGAAIERALEIDPELGEAWIGKAKWMTYLGQGDGAEEAFLEGIRLAPNYATGYLRYGEYLAADPARRREGLRQIEKAISLDPLATVMLHVRANTLIQLGRFDDAEAQLEAIIGLEPEYPRAHATLAELYGQGLGRTAEAIALVERAIELDPGNPTFQVLLAQLHLDLGNPDAVPPIIASLKGFAEDHWGVGVLEVMQSVYRQNIAAAVESAQGLQGRGVPPVMYESMMMFLRRINGEPDQARAAVARAWPELDDRGTWLEMIRQAPGGAVCSAASVLRETGDEALGDELLSAAIAYLEDELPDYTEHADAGPVPQCYAIAGDVDKALAGLETWLDHGHVGAWWNWAIQSDLEALRGEPRFIAVLERAEAMAREQRELHFAPRADSQAETEGGAP